MADLTINIKKVVTVLDPLGNATTQVRSLWIPILIPSNPLLNFMDIIAIDVMFNSKFESSLTLTQSPVQRGANVNDHAYREPRTLVVEFGTNPNPNRIMSLGRIFTAASRIMGAISSNEIGNTTLTALLAAQERKTIFYFHDGIHLQGDLIIQKIEYERNFENKDLLMGTITFQEVIFYPDDSILGLIKAVVSKVLNAATVLGDLEGMIQD